MNRCLLYMCAKCCLDTEMPLTRSDITRISGLGFSESHFVVEEYGNLQLKNSDGRCVFHNGQQCMIYCSRPDGCRFYPAVFNQETDNVITDSDCPHHEEFQLTRRIQSEVKKLVRTLNVEQRRRRATCH